MEKPRITPEGNSIIVELEEKIIKLNGHLDNDTFRVYTEDFVTKLTPEEQILVRKELDKRNYAVD